jgi:DNA-binding MarR family transcriptional regulator
MAETPAGRANKPPSVGIAFLVSQVGAHAALLFAERLAAVNLQPHDAGILRMLGSNSGLSQRAMCDLFGIFPSRLVVLLDGLESKKLIERRDDSADRRRFAVHLTKNGRKALVMIGTLTRALEVDLFAALSASEQRSLLNLLTRIASQQHITPGVHPAYRAVSSKREI